MYVINFHRSSVITWSKCSQRINNGITKQSKDQGWTEKYSLSNLIKDQPKVINLVKTH